MKHVHGFNIGSLISLGDMEQSLDVINSGDTLYKEVIEDDKSNRSFEKFNIEIKEQRFSGESKGEYEEDEEEELNDEDFSEYLDDEDYDEDDEDSEEDDDFSEYLDEDSEEDDEDYEEDDEDYEITDEDFSEYLDEDDEEDDEDEDEEGYEEDDEDYEEDDEDEDEEGYEEDDEDYEITDEDFSEYLDEDDEEIEVTKEYLGSEQPGKDVLPDKPVDIGNDVAKELKELKEQLEIERKARENIEKQLCNEVNINTKINLTSEKSIEQRKAEIIAERKAEILARKKAELFEKKMEDLIKRKKAEQVEAVKLKNPYDGMDIDALYSEVREYISSLGIQSSLIEVKVLNDKFGSHNIKKLILKSYLISIGKGVTIGKWIR